MKWRWLLILLALWLALPVAVQADGPQGFQYVMTKCTGWDIEDVVKNEQRFDTAYGWQHNLTTPAQWSTSYFVRANEFAYRVGCPRVFNENPDGSYYLTFWYRLYQVIYTPDGDISSLAP